MTANSNAGFARAYLLTYRGPSDGPVADGGVTAPVDAALATRVSPALLAAHNQLGRRRSAGETLVAVYPAGESGGFGPAIQIVADHGAMLTDAVTVTLPSVNPARSAAGTFSVQLPSALTVVV